LKTQIDAYANLIAAAADGSKKAIAERKQQRAVVVKMLRQLGHWVEGTAMTIQRSFNPVASSSRLRRSKRRRSRSTVRRRLRWGTGRSVAS